MNDEMGERDDTDTHAVPDTPDERPTAGAGNNFSVDLHGVVELLSNHLYSGPHVYVRELLQNGIDAITARADRAPDAAAEPGDVTFACVTLDGRPGLIVTDTGVGLTETEAAEFMSVIGRSSKRDEIGMARESLIGQFGVGILSCFAVSDTITVRSRAEGATDTVEWVGRSDGTWAVSSVDTPHPVGSSVHLVARGGEERRFEPAVIRRDLARFGELLPHRVWFRVEDASPVLISRPTDVLANPLAPRDEVLRFGADLLGFHPLDYFRIDAPASGTTGLAFVLPYEPGPTENRADRVYVKGMLVSEATDRLMPPWSFFVRCVVNSSGLNPTASREELHADLMLSLTREELGDSLRTQLMELAGQRSERLDRVVAKHHQAMKALAVHDPEFLQLVIDWLPVTTNLGPMPFGDFRARHPLATYARTVDEFRQLAPVATAQGLGLVNGGYIHDSELMASASQVLDDFTASPVAITDLFSDFGMLDEDETESMRPLLELARRHLGRFSVDVELRRFEPWETPALLAMDHQAFRARTLRATGEQSSQLFAGVVNAATPADDDALPVFCLNAANPVIARLGRFAGGNASTDDDPTTVNALEVIYLQALLMGHHPLRAAESALLNTSLAALLERAIGHDE